MRWVSLAVALAAAAVALSMLGSPAESHPGHPQKKLFDGEVWHHELNGDYESWMTLRTSDVWLDCDSTPGACGDKWFDPFDAAMEDWNAQPMTVRFDYAEGEQDIDWDVNVFVMDSVPGDPGLLGLALPFDENDDICFGPCEVYHGDVWIGDDAHQGFYGSDADRQATIAHEVGHLLHLRHESTDVTEFQIFECGTDDTGVIPHSLMAYDCIDPVAIGGAGEYWVQPWDVCGVNHVYIDPSFGFAGCDGTLNTPTTQATPSPTASATPVPTPTPVGQTASPTPTVTGDPTPSATATPTTPPGVNRIWGDINCSGASDPVDSLGLLRHDAGLTFNKPATCPHVTTSVVVLGNFQTWGNVDCTGGIDPIDSLKVLRKDSGQNVNQPAGCPGIGTTVNVVEPG
ncbi:MAG TPA: hypothetical protein VMR52_04440 [Dehalococcoidia bacterium]|nr:hypothetical protein [Dehalococcoidia bacterium]